MITVSTSAMSANWVCGKDLNGDGDIDGPGESASCYVGAAPLCPIEAVSCDTSGTVPTCPLGEQYACVTKGGTPMCSPNQCIDLDVNKPDDIDHGAGDMLVDDGRRDGEGNCIDKMFIFSGRLAECQPSGMKTAYKNCCEDKGVVFFDSTGSIASLARAGGAIHGTYKAAKAAYVAYQAEIAAGGTAETANLAAQGAAKQQLLAAFDPTSLAISIAIYFIMDYLQKACPQMDMETAMLNGSGYCHEAGEYCKKKLPMLGCVQKAKTFCCFNSKLARIIHEQGRAQLKSFNGWGNQESPDCRGFTPDEFQTLDFAKIDLSEYTNDLRHRAQSEIENDIKGKIDDFVQKTH